MNALLANAADIIPLLGNLLRAVCYLLGIVIVVKSLLLAVRRSELGVQAGSWATPITGFLIGTSFLAFPEAVSVGLESIFGSSSISSPSAIFAYGDSLLRQSRTPFALQIVESFAMLAQLLGYIAFARGLFLLNAASANGGVKSFGPGATFIVAGIAAVNFPEFFNLLAGLAVN